MCHNQLWLKFIMVADDTNLYPEIDRVAVIDRSGPVIDRLDRSTRLLTSPSTRLDLLINRPTRSTQSTFGSNLRTEKFAKRIIIVASLFGSNSANS